MLKYMYYTLLLLGPTALLQWENETGWPGMPTHWTHGDVCNWYDVCYGILWW